MSVQISLTLPDTLHRASKKRAEALGYRSMQEYLLELARREMFLANAEKYHAILAQMKKSGKRRTQKEAIEHIKNW